MKPSIALHDIHKLELTPIQHSPPRSESHGRPKCGEYWCRDLVATNVHGEKFTIPLFGEHAAALCLPQPCIMPETVSHEKVGWLQTLISSYDQEHNWSGDPDPDATREMLAWCRLILDEMAGRLPPVPDPAMANAHSDLPF